LFVAFLASMIVIVTASNFLVQYPINDWLTWGAFTYPISFLINDLANRTLGPRAAIKIIICGFTVAILLSIYFATPRIALASGAAFLVAQLIDVYVFDRLRERIWWCPPLISSLLGALLDTFLFFLLAFSMSGLPWITWAVGDFGVKVAMALMMLIPFAALRHALPNAHGAVDQKPSR
jgi:uncharacterized PurR-regulated membrane protein YhhQ (DUF165 family)